MSAGGSLWEPASPGVRLPEGELRAAVVALVAAEPRSAAELAAAIGVPVAVVRNTLASLALVDGVLVAGADGRYAPAGGAS